MEASSSLILGHNTSECPLCIVSFYIVPNTNINILPQDYILLFHSPNWRDHSWVTGCDRQIPFGKPQLYPVCPYSTHTVTWWMNIWMVVKLIVPNKNLIHHQIHDFRNYLASTEKEYLLIIFNWTWTSNCHLNWLYEHEKHILLKTDWYEKKNPCWGKNDDSLCDKNIFCYLAGIDKNAVIWYFMAALGWTQLLVGIKRLMFD